MADALRNKQGLQVELIDGVRGEFTVLVDGREVARKQGDHLPTAEEITAAIGKSPATSGAHA